MMNSITGPDIYLVMALGFVGLVLATTTLIEILTAKGVQRSKPKGPRYRRTIAMLWSLAVVAGLGWVLSGRSLLDIGLASPVEGWRGFSAMALTGLIVCYCIWQLVQTQRSVEARTSIRKQIGQIELGSLRPETRSEAWHFQALSVTAGITEEIVFRGIFIAAFALVMPFWFAVVLSLVAFTLPHAYQGLAGMGQVVITGAVLTVIVLLGGSLWPAIIAHAVIDMTAGLTFALLDRHEERDAEAQAAPGEEPAPAGA